VLAINSRFLTQRITGAQRYAHEITRRILELDKTNDIVLLVPRTGTRSHAYERYTKHIGRLQGHLWEQLELGPWVNRRGGVLWSPCNVGPLVARKHVVTIHDVFSIEYPQWVSWKFHRWYSWLLPRLARRARVILTVSDYSKDRIVNVLEAPPSKVRVIYPGVDARFSPQDSDAIRAVREKYRLPERFILTLGSLEPRKNLHRLVRAWAALSGRERLPLVIAGGLGGKRVFGNYDYKALLTHDSIRLLGYVADEDLPGLYSAADVFVYASLVEGFGLPPVEALACGSRVVTSNNSAMRETSEGLAVLVDPFSVEDITRGLKRALDSPLTRDEAQRNSSLIHRKFSWDAAAKSVWDILSELRVR